jgi:hypothetical protein
MVSVAKIFHRSHTLAMLKYTSSGPQYDRIFMRISSGRSVIDISLPAITDGLEHTYYLLLHESIADAICTWSYTGSKILKHK